MAYPLPIPDSLPWFPISSDFPLEAGYENDLRRFLHRAETRPGLVKKGCIPPNLSDDDYARIALRAQLPNRIAYYGTHLSVEGTQVYRAGFIATPSLTILTSPGAAWSDLSGKLVRFRGLTLASGEFPPWILPPNSPTKYPAWLILHDRTAERGYFIESGRILPHLYNCLSWGDPV